MQTKRSINFVKTSEMLCINLLFFLVSYVYAVPLLNLNNSSATNNSTQPFPLSLKRISLKSSASVDYNFLISMMNQYNSQNGKHLNKTESNYVIYESEHTLTYTFQLAVGSEKQQMDIELDTGSYSLWLPIEHCNIDSQYIFQNSQSSTFKSLNEDYLVEYSNGKNSKGTWATDQFSLGNGLYNIPSLKFGAVSLTSHSLGGVLGVGFVSDMTDQKNELASDANLPVKMFSNHYSSKVAYSIYLNTREDQAGEILFGAIDKAKYSGDLVSLPILMINDALQTTKRPTAFFVSMKQLNVDGINFNTPQSYPALLDTGTSLTFLPHSIYDQFMSSIGVKINNDIGYVTQCGRLNKKTLDFQFENTTIKVPFSEILEVLSDSVGNSIKDSNQNDLCRISLAEHSSDSYILGDSFLRSAYVHYDLTDNVIKIAQAQYTDDIDIVAV